MFWHDHHINNSASICISPCSVFRRHNRLISGRFIAERRRARLLPDRGAALVSAFATKDRDKKDAAGNDAIERDDCPQHNWIGAAHSGLQPSKTTSEEDTDFRELRPRGIEFEQVLSYGGWR